MKKNSPPLLRKLLSSFQQERRRQLASRDSATRHGKIAGIFLLLFFLMQCSSEELVKDKTGISWDQIVAKWELTYQSKKSIAEDLIVLENAKNAPSPVEFKITNPEDFPTQDFEYFFMVDQTPWKEGVFLKAEGNIISFPAEELKAPMKIQAVIRNRVSEKQTSPYYLSPHFLLTQEDLNNWNLGLRTGLKKDNLQVGKLEKSEAQDLYFQLEGIQRMSEISQVVVELKQGISPLDIRSSTLSKLPSLPSSASASASASPTVSAKTRDLKKQERQVSQDESTSRVSWKKTQARDIEQDFACHSTLCALPLDILQKDVETIFHFDSTLFEYNAQYYIEVDYIFAKGGNKVVPSHTIFLRYPDLSQNGIDLLVKPNPAGGSYPSLETIPVQSTKSNVTVFLNPLQKYSGLVSVDVEVRRLGSKTPLASASASVASRPNSSSASTHSPHEVGNMRNRMKKQATVYRNSILAQYTLEDAVEDHKNKKLNFVFPESIFEWGTSYQFFAHIEYKNAKEQIQSLDLQSSTLTFDDIALAQDLSLTLKWDNNPDEWVSTPDQEGSSIFLQSPSKLNYTLNYQAIKEVTATFTLYEIGLPSATQTRKQALGQEQGRKVLAKDNWTPNLKRFMKKNLLSTGEREVTPELVLSSQMILPKDKRSVQASFPASLFGAGRAYFMQVQIQGKEALLSRIWVFDPAKLRGKIELFRDNTWVSSNELPIRYPSSQSSIKVKISDILDQIFLTHMKLHIHGMDKNQKQTRDLLAPMTIPINTASSEYIVDFDVLGLPKQDFYLFQVDFYRQELLFQSSSLLSVPFSVLYRLPSLKFDLRENAETPFPETPEVTVTSSPDDFMGQLLVEDPSLWGGVSSIEITLWEKKETDSTFFATGYQKTMSATSRALKKGMRKPGGRSLSFVADISDAKQFLQRNVEAQFRLQFKDKRGQWLVDNSGNISTLESSRFVYRHPDYAISVQVYPTDFQSKTPTKSLKLDYPLVPKNFKWKWASLQNEAQFLKNVKKIRMTLQEREAGTTNFESSIQQEWETNQANVNALKQGLSHQWQYTYLKYGMDYRLFFELWDDSTAQKAFQSFTSDVFGYRVTELEHKDIDLYLARDFDISKYPASSPAAIIANKKVDMTKWQGQAPALHVFEEIGFKPDILRIQVSNNFVGASSSWMGIATLEQIDGSIADKDPAVHNLHAIGRVCSLPSCTNMGEHPLDISFGEGLSSYGKWYRIRWEWIDSTGEVLGRYTSVPFRYHVPAINPAIRTSSYKFTNLSQVIQGRTHENIVIVNNVNSTAGRLEYTLRNLEAFAPFRYIFVLLMSPTDYALVKSRNSLSPIPASTIRLGVVQRQSLFGLTSYKMSYANNFTSSTKPSSGPWVFVAVPVERMQLGVGGVPEPFANEPLQVSLDQFATETALFKRKS